MIKNIYVDIVSHFNHVTEYVKKKSVSPKGNVITEQITRTTDKTAILSCGHCERVTRLLTKNKAGQVACNYCKWDKETREGFDKGYFGQLSKENRELAALNKPEFE